MPLNTDKQESDSLQDYYEGCPFGCIFSCGKLFGDCRIPWSDDCALNARQKAKNDSGGERE